MHGSTGYYNQQADFVTFSRAIDGLYDFFGRDKKPPKERLQAWFRKVSSFDTKDLLDGVEHMKDALDALPMNIPKALKYAVWVVVNSRPQDETKAHDYGLCADCGQTGIIKLRMRDRHTGVWYEPIAFCGSCENWRNHVNEPGTRYTAAELDAFGIRHKPYNKVLCQAAYKESDGTAKDVERIASDLVKII